MNFKNICNDLAEILESKNKKYGNSFAKTYKEYGNVSICIRLEDKLNRLKRILKGTDSLKAVDTLIDIAGYAVLALVTLGDNGEEENGK